MRKAGIQDPTPPNEADRAFLRAVLASAAAKAEAEAARAKLRGRLLALFPPPDNSPR